MGKLTTHVLDISAGIPAAGVRIEVRDLAISDSEPVTIGTTGTDGRCTAPLLDGDRFRVGRYSLTFYVADYFRGRAVALSNPPFLDRAVVHLGIAHPDQHYHVPLLISPWSYSVYRGG
jgi:5-hydroxyisourate hydrolase